MTYIVSEDRRMNLEPRADKNQVLAIALANLKETLNISNNEIGEIIGVHRNTLARLLTNKKSIIKVKKVSVLYC